MLEICRCLPPYISSTFKHNAIRLNYYCMIAKQQKTPTVAFVSSYELYKTFFPCTPNVMVAQKLSAILNPKFEYGHDQAKNIKASHLVKIISTD